MFKRVLMCILCSIVCIDGIAQNNSFRDKGYKGSVSYINGRIFRHGIETSHGYMINEHNYVGIGTGLQFFPKAEHFPIIGELYFEYQAFWLKKKSTPIADMRLGYIRYLKSSPTINPMESIMISPSIGWAWGTDSGYGIIVSVGVDMIPIPGTVNENNKPMTRFIQYASLSFNF